MRDIAGKSGKSYTIGDPFFNVVDNFTVEDDRGNGQYIFNGNKSGRNVHEIRGGKMTNIKATQFSAYMDANKSLIWSHGYYSVFGGC